MFYILDREKKYGFRKKPLFIVKKKIKSFSTNMNIINLLK